MRPELEFEHEVLLALRDAFVKEKIRLFFTDVHGRNSIPLIHGQKRRYGVLDKDNNIISPNALLIGRNFFLPIEIKYSSKIVRSQKFKKHKFLASHYIGSIPIYFGAQKRIPTRIKVPPAHSVAVITNYRRPNVKSAQFLFIAADGLQELADNIPESAGISRERLKESLTRENQNLSRWMNYIV